ncbi:MAG TPA: methyltransferase domain-containing protein [Candidatus Syntrophosphaera sp.]|nr:methyltransferase domain-containing protein [Candidatus Syntrophosphaera sp.]
MAIPIINDWAKYFSNPHEGMGSSYERIVLNDLLEETAQRNGVENVLESPSFGFTGISGINLLALADNGIAVALEDNDPQRLRLIEETWHDLYRPVNAVLNPDFRCLDYADQAFDMSFSFSALWFVPDLTVFLGELSRVTKKVIFLSVPNRTGLGYRLQFRDYSPEKYPDLKVGHIDGPSIISILSRKDWKLCRSGYFDCPPWPDIGMTKEDLLRKWLPFLPQSQEPAVKSDSGQKTVSILDYYNGKDPDFAGRMRKLQRFEKSVPVSFKKIWAHHFYMEFQRVGQ